jgi:alpha-glucosidase
VTLLREGSVIPLNIAEQHFGRPADERAFIALPHAGAGIAHGGCVEDDGESEAWRTGAQGRWDVTITSDVSTLRISIVREGWVQQPQQEVRLLVPKDDTRAAVCIDGALVADHTADGWRCLTIAIAH